MQSNETHKDSADPGLVTAKILARDPLDEIRRAFALFDSDKTGKIRYEILQGS